MIQIKIGIRCYGSQGWHTTQPGVHRGLSKGNKAHVLKTEQSQVKKIAKDILGGETSRSKVYPEGLCWGKNGRGGWRDGQRAKSWDQ